MALLSLATSVATANLLLCKPQKPFCSSMFPCHLKSSSKTMGKPRRHSSCGVIPINMALTKTEDGVTRRVGLHHPNLWDDGFIQSLPKNYEAPCYVERSEKLIKEVKDIFNVMDKTVSSSPTTDLAERLSLVDMVQRLGIERHFRMEIKQALDYVYSYWKDDGIGCGRESSCTDLNITALGLKILRLQRYEISSDVLEHFKGANGEFLSSAMGKPEEEITGTLNLYRASFIAFPGEKIMDEAKAFSRTYLKHALPKISNATLSREIEYNLRYDWFTNVPRMEARLYIDIYAEDSSTHTSTNKIAVTKLLELARLDFNIIQSMQQRELQIVSRWWTEARLPELNFPRHRHVEFYYWGAGVCSEPQYSAFRIAFAKFCSMATTLDDVYDTYGTVEELRTLTKAIKRWDPSATEGLPEFMQVVYKAFYDSVNESAREGDKAQGRDTLHYARKAWEDYIDTYMQEAEWLAAGYMPTFEEYLHNGKVSSGNRVITLQPVLSLDALLPEDILPFIDYPSRFDELTSLAMRLRGDTRTFKEEAARGEVISCITSYMKSHPGFKEEDALHYLEALIEEVKKELNWEYLKPDDVVPFISKHYKYELTRGTLHMYHDRDGFTQATEGTRTNILQTIIDPVPI